MNGNVETYEIMSDGELYWLDKDTYDEVISHLSESIANQIKILVLSRSGGNVYVTNDIADFVEKNTAAPTMKAKIVSLSEYGGPTYFGNMME